MTEATPESRIEPEQSVAASPPVTLTAAAIAYVKSRRVKMGQPDAALRVGARGGGCNGLTYVTEFTEEPPRAREDVYEFDGLNVYVDRRSLRFIGGSRIDAKNTLMYQGLAFENPNEATRCGCGSTFSVKD